MDLFLANHSFWPFLLTWPTHHFFQPLLTQALTLGNPKFQTLSLIYNLYMNEMDFKRWVTYLPKVWWHPHMAYAAKHSIRAPLYLKWETLALVVCLHNLCTMKRDFPVGGQYDDGFDRTCKWLLREARNY